VVIAPTAVEAAALAPGGASVEGVAVGSADGVTAKGAGTLPTWRARVRALCRVALAITGTTTLAAAALDVAVFLTLEEYRRETASPPPVLVPVEAAMAVAAAAVG